MADDRKKYGDDEEIDTLEAQGNASANPSAVVDDNENDNANGDVGDTHEQNGHEDGGDTDEGA